MFNKKLLIAVIAIIALLALSAFVVSAQQGSGTCPNAGQCPCYGYGTGTEAGEVTCGQQLRYGMQAGNGNGMGMMMGQGRNMRGNHHMGDCPMLEASDS